MSTVLTSSSRSIGRCTILKERINSGAVACCSQVRTDLPPHRRLRAFLIPAVRRVAIEQVMHLRCQHYLESRKRNSSRIA